MTAPNSITVGIQSLAANTRSLDAILESIANIHASCILRDGTIATFLPPLSRPSMIEHWQRLSDQIGDERLILIYVSKVADRSTTKVIDPPFRDHDWILVPTGPGGHDEAQTMLEVSGVVSLSMPHSQTGPFRGVVQKLFISPYHRRKGIAKQLMAELERQALQKDKWSLLLDTTVGIPAEHVYPKLGYKVLGVIQDYGYRPSDRSLADEIFFWKDLRASRV